MKEGEGWRPWARWRGSLAAAVGRWLDEGQRYREVVDGAPDGVCVIDASGIVVIANPKAISMFGDGLVGARFDDLRVAQDAEPMIPGDRSTSRVECLMRGALGEFWASISSAPAVGGMGGFVVIVSDVSERRLEEDDRERLRRSESAKLTARDELLSIAAHELRNHLGGLRFEAALIAKGLMDASPPDRMGLIESVDYFGRQMESLGRLVSNLLDTSQINASKVELHLEDVDLSEVLREVARRFDHEARRTGSVIAISASVDARGRWDRTRIEQVVTNLLSNAVKHGEGKPIEMEASGDGAWVDLRVRDHGHGIAKEHHERIFEQFERVRVPGRNDRGLGLGLWIVRRLVLMHGGTVGVRSEVGRGAEFFVRLPRSTHQAA